MIPPFTVRKAADGGILGIKIENEILNFEFESQMSVQVCSLGTLGDKV